MERALWNVERSRNLFEKDRTLADPAGSPEEVGTGWGCRESLQVLGRCPGSGKRGGNKVVGGEETRKEFLLHGPNSPQRQEG